MLIRGESALNGSWNTIWKPARSGRSVRSGSASMRVPATLTSPCISPAARRISTSASVVLPEPDSPTTPSVVPAGTCRSTSFSTSVRSRANQPFWLTKVQPTWRALTMKPGSPKSSVPDGASAMGSTSRFGWAASSARVYSCRGASNTPATGPCSTTRPWRITTTCSAKARTSGRSCVISSTAMPNCCCRSASSFMMLVCTVTSSAVVGSSAITSFGRQASAMAINARCRCPPDSWCGYAAAQRLGSWMRVSRSSSSVRSSAWARVSPSCCVITSPIWSPMGCSGFSADMGS